MAEMKNVPSAVLGIPNTCNTVTLPNVEFLDIFGKYPAEILKILKEKYRFTKGEIREYKKQNKNLFPRMPRKRKPKVVVPSISLPKLDFLDIFGKTPEQVFDVMEKKYGYSTDEVDQYRAQWEADCAAERIARRSKKKVKS